MLQVYANKWFDWRFLIIITYFHLMIVSTSKYQSIKIINHCINTIELKLSLYWTLLNLLSNFGWVLNRQKGLQEIPKGNEFQHSKKLFINSLYYSTIKRNCLKLHVWSLVFIAIIMKYLHVGIRWINLYLENDLVDIPYQG